MPITLAEPKPDSLALESTRAYPRTTLDAFAELHDFAAWAAEVGMVMDSDADRADYAARGRLFADPGSDVHDNPEETQCR